MPEKKAFVRKHVFINRALQGKYMLTFLIPMVVMLAFWIVSLYAGSDNIVHTTLSLIKKDVENRISAQFQDKAEPTVEDYRVVVSDIQGYLRKFTDTKTYRSEVMSTLLWVFGAGILLVIVQIVLLTVFFSHRVAGPIYRFEKACHNVIDGDYCEHIYLRKGDEMQNLSHLINETVEVTRKRIVALRDEDDPQARRKIADGFKLDIDPKA